MVSVFIMAFPFKLAKETLFRIVDCLNMSPEALLLGITCVAYGTQIASSSFLRRYLNILISRYTCVALLWIK